MHHAVAVRLASLLVASTGLLGCAGSPTPALAAAPVTPATGQVTPPVVTEPPAPIASAAPVAGWNELAPTPPTGCEVPGQSVARTSCDERAGRYCEQVGQALDDGDPGPVDPAVRRACADWFHHRACDLREINGCDALKKHLPQGVSAAPIEARIIALLAADCAREGGETTCVQLGISYEIGRDVARDEARAAAIYEKACASVPVARCIDLALGKPPLATKTLYGAARKSLEGACGRSEAAACAQLGVMNEEGRGAPKDLATAAKLYRKACDGGFGAGCTSLANVAKNPAAKAGHVDSAALLAKGCEAGDAAACASYADLPGLSNAAVFKAISRACGGGDDHACWRLSHDSTVVPPK
jgi:hypothetical protein